MNKVSKALVAITAVSVLAPASSMASGVPVREATLSPGHPGAIDGERDASGTARLKLYPALGKICYDLRYEDITVFHIDINRMKDQEMVQELYHRRPTDDRLNHCKRGIASNVIRALKQRPKAFFIRASEYRGGDIAGTIHRP